MNGRSTSYIERFASGDQGNRFLGMIGIDSRQFLLFLRLFRTLSERNEFMGTIALNRDALTLLVCFSALSGVVLAIPALLKPPIHAFLFGNLMIMCVYVLSFSMGEAANQLCNPIEAIVLAHHPVHSSTYVAAKIAHILVPVSYLVTTLCLPSALLGIAIKGTYWIWPITHLLAAFGAGLTIALLVCSLYGWLVRLSPARFLKSLAMWTQFFAMGGFFSVWMLIPFWGGSIYSAISGRTWIPLTWFVKLGILGCNERTQPLGWGGGLAFLMTLLVVWFGLRSFSGMYFSEASPIVKGQTKRSHPNDARTRLLSPLIAAITGGPSGLAAFSFTGAMMRRDWQFRRALLAPLIYVFFALLILILVVTNSRLEIAEYLSFSPFEPHKFSPAFALPHLWGLLSITSCIMISFTDLPGSSWIFSLAPLEDLRSFSKGVYCALWIPAVGLPHLLILPFLVRFWGWMDALIFIGFVLVVLSCYLALEMLLISGLPFSNPFDASKPIMGMAVQFIGAMVIGFVILLHYLAFHTRGVALTAGSILSVVTFLTLRLTLRCYEKAICQNLQNLQTRAAQL
jgi:hypothetical protein